MNASDSDQTLPEVPATADAEAAPKTRRKRAPRAAAADGTAEAAPAAASPAADDAEAPAKPRRTRRKAAADDGAEPVAAAAGPAPVSAAPGAESSHGGAAAAAATSAAPAADASPAPAPAKPPRARRKSAEAAADGGEAAGGAPAAASAPVAAAAAPAAPVRAQAEPTAAGSAPAEAAAPAATAEAAGPANAGGPAAEGDGEAGGRRRNRNRRRGRRGGERAEREGAPEGDAEFTLVTVAPEAGDDEDDGATEAGSATAPAAARSTDAGTTFAAVVSGDYDAEAGEVAPEPEKRVLLPDPDAPKLHKVLAQAGIGSRRDMEQLIADGKVEVNGQPAHVGQRISFGDRIRVGGRMIKVRIAPLPPRVIAYHKPVGEVVTHDDPQHRPTVFRRLPRLPQGKWQSVGRLDINTEGLLLFTNSGELANQLMHPRFGVEREYAVRVLGTLDEAARDKLLQGVEIEGQRAAFKSIEDGGGEGANHWYRVVITEGRNREVRKLFDKVGLGVSRLIRIRYGCVVLPRGLRRGVYVDLNQLEVGELRRLAAKPAGQGGGQHPQPRGDGEGRGPREARGGKEGRGPRDRDRDRERDAGGAGGGGQQQRRDKPKREQRPRDPDAEFASIPNPLMQTFDKRAIREARQPRREYSEDGPIPNPLEQTYDKRFVQKGKSPFGGGGRKGGGGGGAGGGQPDPMKTSVGYIGADAFVRKFQNQGGGGGGGGGGGRGGKRRGGR